MTDVSCGLRSADILIRRKAPPPRWSAQSAPICRRLRATVIRLEAAFA